MSLDKFTVGQKIEFLQEIDVWQNPSTDLSPPELLKFTNQIIEANELTCEELEEFFAKTVVDQVSQESDVEESEPPLITKMQIKLDSDDASPLSRMDSIVRGLVHDSEVKDVNVGNIHSDNHGISHRSKIQEVVLRVKASSYRESIAEWLTRAGQSYLLDKMIVISFPSVGMSPDKIGDMVAMILKMGSHYSVALEWISNDFKKTRTTDQRFHPSFTVRGLYTPEDCDNVVHLQIDVTLD